MKKFIIYCLSLAAVSTPAAATEHKCLGFRYLTNELGTLPFVSGFREGWNVVGDVENVPDSQIGITVIGPAPTITRPGFPVPISGYADYVRRSLAICGARVAHGDGVKTGVIFDGHKLPQNGADLRADNAQNFELYSPEGKLLVKYNSSTYELQVARAAGNGFDKFTINSAIDSVAENGTRNYGQSVGDDGGLQKEVSLASLNTAQAECGKINLAELKVIKNTMVGAAVVSGVGAAGNIVASGFNVANAVKGPAAPGESGVGDETAKPEAKNVQGTVNAVASGVGAATGTAAAVMSGVSAKKLNTIIEQIEKCQSAMRKL